MRMTLDNDCGVYNYTLVDTDGDGIIGMEFSDEYTGINIKLIDGFGNTVTGVFDRKELKQYLELVLSAFDECE